jgi:pimeloyl-ACP methyl ester carboxylesterase
MRLRPLALFVSGLLALGLSGCRAAYLQPLPKEAVGHRVRTQDGWELSLTEYPAQGAVRGRPVLLLHGISANDRNMDLDEGHSLARFLAAHGRPVWNVSLRGTGTSDAADPARGRAAGYDFDTCWKQDLTAAVAYVREHTGGQPIDFVGHSLGGLMLYAYLGQGGDGISAAVTLGSPTRLDWGLGVTPLIPMASLLVNPSWVLPVVDQAALAIPLTGALAADPMQVLLYNARNVEPETWRRLLANGVGDLSLGVPLQLVPLVREGRFLSADGKVDYRAGMARIRTPILVVAGKLDRVGVVPAVKDGYRALGGPKEWLLLGEENGARADYGHLDLLIGERASTELFPQVLDFLDRHPGDSSR